MMHETTDASSKGIATVGAGAIAAAVVIQLGLGAMFFALRRQYQKVPPQTIEARLLQNRTSAPNPRLQIDPAADLELYLEREKRLLSSYGWINRKEGIARIPIQRAMNLLVHPPGRKATRKSTRKSK